MTVTQVKPGITDEYSSKKYVGVLLQYRNGSKQTVSMGNSMYLQLLDGDGTSYGEGLVMNAKYPDLNMANVTPGRSLRGWVFFEQPKTLKGAYLQFDNFSTSANVALG